MHSIDARFMTTQIERDIAFRRHMNTSHLGARLALEDMLEPAAPSPRRGWFAGFDRFATN